MDDIKTKECLLRKLPKKVEYQVLASSWNKMSMDEFFEICTKLTEVHKAKQPKKRKICVAEKESSPEIIEIAATQTTAKECFQCGEQGHFART